MKRKLGFTLAAAGLAGFALVGPGQADPGFDNKYPGVTQTEDCGDGDIIEYAGPLKMWPPNHKLQDVSITATDGSSANPADAASDETTLNVTANLLDAVGGDGGPRHDPDIFFPAGPMSTGDPSATVPVQLRSERSGKGEGRTYTLNATATFDGLAGMAKPPCTMEITVFVPHDMRGGADWK
jgi:hypothetical protein